MNIETKSFDIKIGSMETDGKGMIHAVVSVFDNVDSVGDVMVKGAFANSIKSGKEKSKLPPGVWAHDWNRPVAKTLDAWETDEGLNVLAQFNLETKDGQDAYSNVKNGLFTEYSFGFRRVKGGDKEDDGKNYVKNVDWLEWSPVLVGANRETRTVGVKREGKGFDLSDFPTERHFERWLTAAGLTRSFATIVVSKGYKQQDEVLQREADEAATPEPDAQAPEPTEPDPQPPAEEIKTEETDTKTEEEPAVTAPPPRVVDVKAALLQAQVQALYADHQARMARYGLGEHSHHENIRRDPSVDGGQG